jgi:hypothetical protein
MAEWMERIVGPAMHESNEAERNEVFGGTIPTIPYYYFYETFDDAVCPVSPNKP